MINPFNSNLIEQVHIDPTNIIDGMVWFNTTDKVYKTFIDDTLHIFLTTEAYSSQVDGISSELSKKQFTIDFLNANNVVVTHNKNNKNFIFEVYDLDEQSTLHTSIDIISENEVHLNFIDPVSGSLFMHFK